MYLQYAKKIFISCTAIILAVLTVCAIFPLQTQAVETTADNKNCVVTYMVDGNEYYSETVLKNTLANFPADPAAAEGQAPFLCWYAEGEAVPFSPRRLITENITLTAHFSENNLVTYFDENGIELGFFEFTPSTLIPEFSYDEKLSLGEEFSYWYIEGSPDTPFQFNTAISENIVLLPKIVKRNVAVFITKGPEVEPQVGLDGFYAQDPAVLDPDIDLSRDGYDFLYWSSEENGTTPFDFEHTEIKGTMRIYAVWKAKLVDYTIDFWNEKVNVKTEDLGDPSDPDQRGNFERVYSKFISQGAYADSNVTISMNDAYSHYRSGGSNIIDLLNYSTYIWSETKEISGTGTTTINVYFKRTEFTFNFDPRKSEKYTATTNIGVPSAYLKTSDGATQTLPYSITVKLGQSIRDIWPAETGRTDGSSLVFVNWNGYYGNNTETVSVSYITTTMQPDAVTGRPKVTSGNLGVKWQNAQYTEIRRYYGQNINDERLPDDVAFTTKTVSSRPWADSGNTHYYSLIATGPVSRQMGNPATSAIGWPGRDVPGFDTITARNTEAQNPYYLSQFYQTVEPRTPGETNPKDFYINYYMLRKKYTLTLKTNGGTLSNFGDFTEIEGPGTPDAEKVLFYEEPFQLPPNPVLENHTFGGWYMDEDLTIPANLIQMPANNVTYYAKYIGQQTTVNYYDGTSLLTSNVYERGDFILSHELEDTGYENYKVGQIVPEKGEFQGWYYQVGDHKNSFVPFPLEIRLTRETYDIYAEWKPITYTVTYHGDEGTGMQEYGTQSVLSGNYNTLALSGQHTLTLPERQHYEFLGWNTEPDGSGTQFTASVPITENIDVYAIWRFAIPFSFIKVDSVDMTAPLSNAVFTLYSCSHEHTAACGGLTDPDACSHVHDTLVTTSGSGCWQPAKETARHTVTTTANGVVSFGYLPEGVYQLAEAKSPDGYQLPAGQWRLTVSPDDPNILSIEAKGEILPPAFVEQNKETFTYLLPNRKILSLPLTGESGTAVFYLIGGSIVVLAVFLILYQNKTIRFQLFKKRE